MPIISRRYPARAALVALALLGSIGVQTAPLARHAGVARADSSTLIVDFISDFSHLDPSLCYDTQCYSWMHAMYDQLIGYDTAHGNGDTLIPDAATAMPTRHQRRQDVRVQAAERCPLLGREARHGRRLGLLVRADHQSGDQVGGAGLLAGHRGGAGLRGGKAPHVSGIKAIGKFGLEVDLNSPYVGFLNVLAMPFGSVLEQGPGGQVREVVRCAAPDGDGSVRVHSSTR